ncbi:MAG: hybrid sensor histidine kinase/response regulator, partial [Desulfuromonadales bacterium]|nr:hybrid sensor histidine kinase/response regulator [Desulfuromonadales bacterium]
ALGHVSAGMAHEIRNPLNSINLFAQLLLIADSLDEENRGYVYKITQEVERIDETLIQMLASSSGTANKQQRVDLAAVIDKTLSDYQTRIDQQNISIDLNIDRSAPTIAAASLEIEQVFANLIGNALYEMENGGILTISLHTDGEKLLVTVADTGNGIPHDIIQHIFDPFFTTKAKGTGFGLSVVMRIVKNLGGKVTVTSPAGSGACFLLELPFFHAAVH